MKEQPLGRQRNVDHESATANPETVDLTGAYQPTPQTEPHVWAPREDPPFIPGYTITHEIARGGMGRVLAGTEERLDREVAIKTLLPKANAERFITESKITARLPHPGIPPVYALGTLADGSPYLAMKLIRGRTLHDLLNERATVSTDLTRFVQIFEQIAQSVGFAHSRGIIHRDLKPQNVMVGEFGEVQVMDWGLAKDQTSRERGRPEDVANGQDELQTQSGTIMGTPAYMAPEQARGEVVDARADVFSLGSILCSILTGHAVFAGDSAYKSIELALAGDTALALTRLKNSGADAELVAVATTCLTVNREDRPTDGLAVAKLVAIYRNGVEERVKIAEKERGEAIVREAEQRKRRRVVQIGAAALAAVLVAGIVGTTLGLYKANESRNQAILAERATAAQLAKTRKAEAAANAKTKEVQETLMIVGQRTKLAQDAFGDMVFDTTTLLENRPGTQELRRALLDKARAGLSKILDDARKQGTPDSTLAWSHFRMGDVEQQLGNTLAAKTEFEAGHEIAHRLAVAEPKNIQARRDLSWGFDRLGSVTLLLGQTQTALDYYKQSLDIRQRIADADRKNSNAQSDLSVSYDALGNVTLLLGQTQAALDYYKQSLDIRQRLAEAHATSTSAQRDLLVSYYKIGTVALQLGQPQTALNYFKRELDIAHRLVDDDPNNTYAQRALFVSLDRVGAVALQLGQMQPAQDYYRKALDIAQRLADADPKNTKAQRDLCGNFVNLGNLTLQLGQIQQALDYYKNSLDTLQRLADAEPTNTEAQRDLGMIYERLGDGTFQLGQTQIGLEYLKKALAIRQRLADADRNNTQAQRDLSLSFDHLGKVTHLLGQTQTALDYYKQSLDIRQRIADADAQNAQFQVELFVSFYNLGKFEKLQNNYVQAAEWFGKGRAVLLPWHEKKLLVGQFKNSVAVTEQELAICLKAEKALSDVDYVLKQPAAEVPGLLDIRVQVSAKKNDLKNLLATAEVYEKLATSDDKQCYNAACAWSQASKLAKDDAKQSQEYAEKAMTQLRKTPTGRDYFVDSPSKLAAHMINDADMNPLRERDDFKKLIADLEKREPKMER